MHLNMYCITVLSLVIHLPSFQRSHIQCEYFKFFYITLKVKTNENQGGVGSVADESHWSGTLVIDGLLFCNVAAILY
jgi:hypothetical protein